MADTTSPTAQHSYTEVIRRTPVQVTPESVEAIWRLFAPAHLARSYQAPVITRDHPYGADERQRLDVHAPAEQVPDRTRVLLFVCGGGFVAGDKQTEGTPYYDNVGGWAVANGLVGVTMNYRLAPRHPWPAGAEDVAAAVDWVRENITATGGDPDRIVVVGHSAGASHVAGYLAGHSGTPPRAAAAVLLSGIYDLRDEKEAVLPYYYGPDPATYPARQPLRGLLDSPVPVLYCVAEYDPPNLHRQAATVIAAHHSEHGVVPPFVRLEGHNHVSQIVSLGVDDAVLGAALIRFIEGNTQ
ncbi:MAG TPA: alpha/beta hydrolase [Amycolatopsis sp.]|nr:alpha/beta hydrolase [Amycolatopsis sp.]